MVQTRYMTVLGVRRRILLRQLELNMYTFGLVIKDLIKREEFLAM